MKALIITTGRDGQQVEIARVFEDGRFKGEPGIKELIEQQLRGTGARGPRMLQEVQRSFSNGYVNSSLVEVGGGSQSAGTGDDEQPRPPATGARQAARPR